MKRTDCFKSVGFGVALHMLIARCLVLVARVQGHMMTHVFHHDAEFAHLFGERTRRVIERGLCVGEADDVKSHAKRLLLNRRCNEDIVHRIIGVSDFYS